MSSLFGELKRRNVFKVAVAYVVVGWIVMQVADTITPYMNLPEWAGSTVLFFLIVGFPISIFFSWVYELTPEGLKKQKDIDRDVSITVDTGRKIDFIIIGALVLAIGGLVWDRGNITPKNETVVGEGASDQVTLANTSIAVLPFVNMSDDKSNEYFSDGISEEILNVLAKIPNLQVTSRSSAFQFKGDDIHIPTVAKTLGVANVLEGSVRKSGTKVRITAQLIDAASDKHLWSETYDRELTDIFAVQDEISAAIVDALKTTMGLEVAIPLKVEVAANNEAHEAYLRGRHLVVQRTNESVAAAAEEFKKAIFFDANYAKAYAELALAYLIMTPNQYGDMAFEEAIAKARPYAEKAMVLAPQLPEAHAAIGFSLWKGNTTPDALKHFDMALKLNPNYADVQNWISNIYTDDLGLYKKAADYREKALAVNPLSIPGLANSAYSYLRQGKIGKSDVIIEKLKSLSPLYMGLIKGDGEYLFTNNQITGLDTYLKTLGLSKTFSRLNWSLYVGFRDLGMTAEMKANIPKTGDFFFYSDTQDYKTALEMLNVRIAEKPLVQFFQVERMKAQAALGDVDPMLSALEKINKENKIVENGLYQIEMAYSLIYARRLKNPKANIEDVLTLLKDNFSRLKNAGMGHPYIKASEGVYLYYSGEKQAGLDQIYQAVKDGAFLDMNNYIYDELYKDPRFQKTKNLQLKKVEIVKNQFLVKICGENPYAAYWQPQPETCEKYEKTRANQ